ncbi:MAG: ComEC/Rec2 family competence protein [Flavobacteriales bacterium]|nr:ComEC/Rec2 family competence protein [Flavobacteriales bacterium]
MPIFRYPIIRLCLAFLVGICLERNVVVPIVVAATLFIAFIVGSVGVFSFWLKAKRHKLISSISIYGLLFILGCGVWKINTPQNQLNHYSKQFTTSEKVFVTATVTETIRDDSFIVEIQNINSNPSKGTLLLSIKRDSIKPSFYEGQHIRFYAKLESLQRPLHPSQFDYAQYMALKGVYYKARIDQKNVWILNEVDSWLFWRGKIKRQLIALLNELGFSSAQMDVISALFLGNKKAMTQELKTQYINAGVVHVLAISGLHIGIIMWFLGLLLKPLERLKNGNLISSGLIIVMLWGIAFFTGLSPSVVRAVTMFSFLTIALQSKREHNIYNALFGSMFVLLICRPQFLFDVGFQLSYVAVFSIVAIYPLFKKLYYSRHTLIQYGLDLVYVSLAAQIGVLPLSLFYFHHFSGLFLVGNILVIPILTLLLIVGFPALFVLSFSDASWLVKVLQFLINGLNKVTLVLSKQSDWVFDAIYFSGVLMVLSYFVLLSVLYFLNRGKGLGLIGTLIGVLCFQGYLLYKINNVDNKGLVFHQYKKTLLIDQQSGGLKVFKSDNEENAVEKQFLSTVYKDTVEYAPLNNYHSVNNQKVLVLDKTGEYVSGFCPDVLLLTHSSRVNLERVINELKPKRIIADGSNYPSLIEKWRATALKHNIPFQSTAEKGYCVIE